MNRSLTLSDEQNDIVLTVNNRISSYVNAVPGAGKTTVSLYVSKYSTDCQLLLLTFSSDLKTDARLKKAKLKINNLDIHSYNSFPRPFYDKEAIQDEDIYNIIHISKLINQVNNTSINLDQQGIFIDEVFHHGFSIMYYDSIKNGDILNPCITGIFEYFENSSRFL